MYYLYVLVIYTGYMIKYYVLVVVVCIPNFMHQLSLLVVFTSCMYLYVQCNWENRPQFVQALFWQNIEFGGLAKYCHYAILIITS